MQDTAIAAIGRLQIKKMKDLEPEDLYIQNMYPGKEYDMILIVFGLPKNNDKWECNFKNIDIEKVSPDSNYKKYAYRKGSARGGDITFTTKFGDIEKKINTLVNNQFKSLIIELEKTDYYLEREMFLMINNCLIENIEQIKKQLQDVYENFDKNAQKSTGISLCFKVNGENKYLRDFQIIKDIVIENGTEGKSQKHGVTSFKENQLCSITQKMEEKVFGFAFPFKYSTVDKKGFVSGFFNQKNNWKNYPISEKAALEMEIGKNFITQNLQSYFYGTPYFMIPKPILQKDEKILEKIIIIISELTKDIKNKRIETYEDYIERMIAKENDFFNLDLMFYEENPTTKAINIKLMLEEILPSRFRTLFVDMPAIINDNELYKNAITIKKEKHNLTFNFGIIKTFFADDFLEVVQKIFLGRHISKEYVFEKIIEVIRQNYNKSQTSDNWVEPIRWTVLKAHLLINYLQKLQIVNFNKNYKFMDAINNNSEETGKKESFNLTKYKGFIEENKNFLDADQKIGLFSVGVLVRLLYNIQNVNLGSTPFEKKLRGYHLNVDLIKNIYVEALEKIGQYLGFYAYGNLRSFINEYFVLKSNLLNKMSNNELSFYFVAGLELGNKFKTEKEK
jgi:CRISPR-associated protein Csh1